MKHSRAFRYLVVLVVGMIAGGAVIFRFAMDDTSTLFKRTALRFLQKQPVTPNIRLDIASPANIAVKEMTQRTEKAAVREESMVKLTNDRVEVTSRNMETRRSTKSATTTNTIFVKQTTPPTDDDKLPVPRIVHYAWYSDDKLVFRFHHFISVLSAYKHIKPKKIMFWYEIEPKGHWWTEIRKRVPVIELVYRKGPTEIFGREVKVAEHKSDIVRLEAVMNYGGIYTDLDVVILKSFDPLRKFNFTMGYESPGALCNGVIISAPNATFLKIWYDSYRTFDDGTWSYHSVLLPAQLAKKHPELIHTEEDTLNHPDYTHIAWFYNESLILDWSKKYSIHLWYRFHKVDHNPEDIKTLNTTMGQLFRYTYYGSKDLIT